MAECDVTAQLVRQRFNYDPITGIFTNRIQWGARGTIGKEPGGISEEGYRRFAINRIKYLAHRVAWLHVHGEWPKGEIDHINGNKLDNRIQNLRDVSHTENIQNMRLPFRNKTSGLPLGVHHAKNRFMALLNLGGKSRYLGSFDTPSEAHAAYVEAKRLFHPGSTL